MSLWWGLQEVCPVCVYISKCVSMTLKSDTSSHSTAKTHPSSITVSFSIPHHVLLLMGDPVIFSAANVAPKRYPRILFQNKKPTKTEKRKKKTLPPTKTKSTEKSMSQPETNASLDSLDVLDHPPHRLIARCLTRLPWRWFGQTASGVPHICLFGQRWQQVKAVIKIYNKKKTACDLTMSSKQAVAGYSMLFQWHEGEFYNWSCSFSAVWPPLCLCVEICVHLYIHMSHVVICVYIHT